MPLFCSKFHKSQILLRIKSRVCPWPLKFHRVVPLASSLVSSTTCPFTLWTALLFLNYGRHTASGPLHSLSTWNVLYLQMAQLALLHHLALWLNDTCQRDLWATSELVHVFSHWPYPPFSVFMSFSTLILQFSNTNGVSSNSMQFWCWFLELAQTPIG